MLFRLSPQFLHLQKAHFLGQLAKMSSSSTSPPAHLPDDLLHVDWSKLPAPVDDGAAAHLQGVQLPPDLALAATNGQKVALGSLQGRTVLFAYPRSGTPLIDWREWDALPGARGCTPHSCSFRDKFEQFKRAGVSHVSGLSTEDTPYQLGLLQNAHLPFPLLSDEQCRLADAIRLPTMEVAGKRMIKRLALVLDGGRVSQVFYPVFPPDKNAEEVLRWLEGDGEKKP